jgi:hypothetical protein
MLWKKHLNIAAIHWAVGNRHARVERADVAKAEAEIRSEYRRFLTQEQREA